MKVCGYVWGFCVFNKGIRCNYKDYCDLQTEVDPRIKHKPRRLVRELRE